MFSFHVYYEQNRADGRWHVYDQTTKFAEEPKELRSIADFATEAEAKAEVARLSAEEKKRIDALGQLPLSERVDHLFRTLTGKMN